MPCCAPLWAFPLSLSNLGRSSSLSHGKIITVKNKKFCCCFDLDRNPMTAAPDPQTLKIQKFFIENVQVQEVKMNWEKIKNNPNLSKKLFSYFQKCYFSIEIYFFHTKGQQRLLPSVRIGFAILSTEDTPTWSSHTIWISATVELKHHRPTCFHEVARGQNSNNDDDNNSEPPAVPRTAAFSSSFHMQSGTGEKRASPENSALSGPLNIWWLLASNSVGVKNHDI